MLDIDDFVQDTPWTPRELVSGHASNATIDGVSLFAIDEHSDHRGNLCELLTLRNENTEPIPHVYRVNSAPGSIRGWVYHKWQSDRLAFTEGQFRIVLYDIREDSKSYGNLDILELGEANRGLLVIPPLVVHGVANLGKSLASFVNMPTRAYDPANPDKWRVPIDHPGIPYSFQTG